MERFPRMFVLSSLFYLLVGGAIGTWMMHNPDTRGWYRWSHLHLMVLGFIGMMIFGVAYHVLPRFAGNAVWSPKMGYAHWVCANVGLWGMAGGWVMHARDGFAASSPWGRVLTSAADLQYLGMWLFVVNISMSLRHRPKPVWLQPAHPAAAQPQGVQR